MANRQKVCKGQQSDSSCTCNSNHECQDDSKYEKSINSNINDTLTTPVNKQNNECSSECINCKLLNRLYLLLEEIVENRKNAKTTEEFRKSKYDKNTRMSLKNNDEETSIPNENYMRLPNTSMDDKKCKIFNVYNNNTGSNNLTLCDCDKTNPSKCSCVNKKEDTVQKVLKTNENTTRSSAQYWHSVGEIKKQNHVDIACQCTCSKKDSSTQDDSKQEEVKYEKLSNTQNKKEDMKTCNCMDSAVNTDTQQNNSCVQNLYCSLSNDPRFREAMKLMPCPNVVVLSNGCSCCNKCNTPIERTSVTTNTSEIIVTTQEKNGDLISLKELDTTQIDEFNRESFVTFPKKRELSFSSNIKTLGSSISRSIKDLPRQSGNKNLFEDTTFMIPQDSEFTVAAALVPKNGKKKSTPKSKKRKSKTSGDSKESANDKKDFINSCCQTDKTEEKCEQMLKIGNNLKDAAICCDMNNCNEIYPKLVKKESIKNTVIKNETINSCNCTDIRNFVAVITELCAQMNNKNTNDLVPCECCDKNTSAKSSANSNKDDCLEIHRLAEKIAEIQLKSNQTKNGSPNRMSRNELKNSIDLAKSTNSDCDLTNCIHINPLPSHNVSDDTEECYCKVCPCKKTAKYDRKDVCPVRKEKRGRSSINPASKRGTKKLSELEYANLNKWTQQYPSVSPHACVCNNYECMDEKEIGCLNYNISDNAKDDDNCNAETCPQLRRIIKDCLCGSKNCYCHNEKLNEIKTTAKLERLADEVISTITPCNCIGQQCTCTNNNMDPGTRRYTAR